MSVCTCVIRRVVVPYCTWRKEINNPISLRENLIEIRIIQSDYSGRLVDGGRNSRGAREERDREQQQYARNHLRHASNGLLKECV